MRKVNYRIPQNLPSAIKNPDSPVGYRFWVEPESKAVLEVFDRRIVDSFRRSSKITLPGQVSFYE